MGRSYTFRGKTRLLFQVLRINLKKSLITLIGMTIALAIIAASLIYLESNEINYYLEVLEDPVFEQPLICHLDEIQGSGGNLSVEDFTLIHNALDEKFTEYNLNNTLIQSDYPFHSRMDRESLFLNTSEGIRFLGITLDESIIEDCVNNSKIPSAQNEVLVVIPSNNAIELAINETIYLSPFYKENNSKKYYNLSLKISGILTETSIHSSSQLWHMVDVHDRINFIMDITRYLEVLNTLRTLSDERILNQLDLYYSFDFSEVNHQNARQIVHGLVEFGRGDWWDLDIQVVTPNDSKWFNIYPRSRSWYYTIKTSLNEFQDSYFLFTILCLPAFIITFLLVNFSLGVVNEGRRKTLALYKMRGISKKFILTILSVETLTLALIASVLGLILGLLIYFLISTTTGYLSFDLNRWPDLTIVSQATIGFVIGFSLCFTFLLHLRTIIKLANASIIFLEEEASKKKKRKRGTIRQNIDVFLLVQGIIGIILLDLLLRILNVTGQLGSEMLIFGFLILILAFLSPLCLLIGFIFAFNRLMPVILEKLGGIFWKKDFRLLAIATRNLLVNMKFATRTTLLIAVTISFLMILSSFPLSLSQHAIEKGYYGAGSDLIIQTWDLADESAIRNLSNALNELPGLTSTIVSIAESAKWDRKYFDIMGIEDNFDEVAFWKPHYANQPLSNLVSTLFSLETQVPVIIDSYSGKIEKLEVNDRYLLDLKEQIPLNLTIVAKTDFWPGLIERYANNERFLIIKRSIFNNFTFATYQGFSYIWCKIDPKADKYEVLEQARNVTLRLRVDLRSFHPTNEGLDVNPDSFEATILWIITNFDFLVALVVLLLLLFLFTMTRTTNQLKEIGLSRAFGLKFQQVFCLMFIEPFLLVLISGVPGGLIGLGLLMIFISFGQGPPFNYGPPFIFVIDIPSILLIFSSILITVILSGLITSYRVTRADVSKILKVE